MSKRRTYITSRLFLLVVSTIYLIDYVLGLNLSESFAILPVGISERMEFWRLFLFPFAYSSIESFLLFAAVFYFISPKLEEIVLSIAYPLWLSLLTFLQGGFLTLIFWQESIYIGGAAGLSIFVLTLFTLLKPHDYIKIASLPRVPNYILSSLILSMWLAIKFLLTNTGAQESMMPTVATASFGIAMASLIFAQVKMIEYFRMRRLRKSQQNMKMPKPEELSVALMNSKSLKKYYRPEETEEDDYMLSSDRYENESILNDILDKMNDEGKESLTHLEKRFLEQYAKYIEEE